MPAHAVVPVLGDGPPPRGVGVRGPARVEDEAEPFATLSVGSIRARFARNSASLSSVGGSVIRTNGHWVSSCRTPEADVTNVPEVSISPNLALSIAGGKQPLGQDLGAHVCGCAFVRRRRQSRWRDRQTMQRRATATRLPTRIAAPRSTSRPPRPPPRTHVDGAVRPGRAVPAHCGWIELSAVEKHTRRSQMGKRQIAKIWLDLPCQVVFARAATTGDRVPRRASFVHDSKRRPAGRCRWNSTSWKFNKPFSDERRDVPFRELRRSAMVRAAVRRSDRGDATGMVEEFSLAIVEGTLPGCVFVRGHVGRRLA